MFSLFDEIDRQYHLSESDYVPLEKVDNGYRMEVDMPGVAKENISIKVKDRTLFIKGDRNTSKKSKYERSYILPRSIDMDDIKATHKDGVLILDFEIKEDKQIKEISIS
jgi:HSP20 family protein